MKRSFHERMSISENWLFVPSLAADIDGAVIYGDDEPWIVHSLMLSIDLRTGF